MFDILVYLYETYYRPDACPEPVALAKKLSAVGFDDVEISEALVWLATTAMAGVEQSLTAASTGTRFYVDEEHDALGSRHRLHPVPRIGQSAVAAAARNRDRTGAVAGRAPIALANSR
jgi:hypothetical protein